MWSDVSWSPPVSIIWWQGQAADRMNKLYNVIHSSAAYQTMGQTCTKPSLHDHITLWLTTRYAKNYMQVLLYCPATAIGKWQIVLSTQRTDCIVWKSAFHCYIPFQELFWVSWNGRNHLLLNNRRWRMTEVCDCLCSLHFSFYKNEEKILTVLGQVTFENLY